MQKKPAGIFKDSMEAEVLNLSGKPEDVENFLAELNTSQSQLLWKKFELSRQRDGVTKDYEHAVAGTGTLQEKGMSPGFDDWEDELQKLRVH